MKSAQWRGQSLSEQDSISSVFVVDTNPRAVGVGAAGAAAAGPIICSV